MRCCDMMEVWYASRMCEDSSNLDEGELVMFEQASDESGTTGLAVGPF